MVLSKSLRERVADRIAGEVSPNCVHRLPTGRCQQPEDLPCPITNNFDSIIDIVRSVSSDGIELWFISQFRGTALSPREPGQGERQRHPSDTDAGAP